MFFYELHEGDTEIYSDVLVVSESEWEPQEFFELVQRIRHDLKEYSEDTLIEAIAMILERDHGFVYVNDERLVAAVNVSTEDADNFLADLDAAYGDEDDDDDDDDDDDAEPRGDYRTLLAELDLDDKSRHELAAEQDLEHVAVLDPVGLPLRAQAPRLLRLAHRAELEQVLVRDGLGPDEALRARSVWMAPAASTAVEPSGTGQARTSSGPAVRNETSPSSR